MKRSDYITFKEHVCPICGKIFIANVDWAYRQREHKNNINRYYCSWHCMRKWEAIENERKASRKSRKRKDSGSGDITAESDERYQEIQPGY